MSFLGTLFSIALPIILQNFLNSFVNMLDTIMVGQLGSIDIAAVGLGNQIFFVMNIMIFGVVSGGSIFISQYWGKKDMDSVHRTMGIIMAAGFVISFFFFCAATFIPQICLKVYTSDEQVIAKGCGYLRAVAPSYLLIGIGFPFSQALRSTERVKLPMFATGFSVILNGILNYLFIFGIRLGSVQLLAPYGIIGAAVATDIARILELIILIGIPVSKRYEVIAPFNHYLKVQSGFIPRYIKVAIPVFINESLWGIGTSLQSSIYAHAGTDVIAAFNITSTISNLIWTFFIGSGNAAAIIIGKKIGEGKSDEARSLAKKCTGFMAGSGFCLGLLLIPLSFLLKYFFKVEPEVIHMAQTFLFIMAFLYPLFAVNMCTVVGVCRSGGDTIYALIMDVGFMWIISLPLGFLAVTVWGIPFWGIYLILNIENLCKTTMGIIRLRSGKWLHDLTSQE